MKLLSIETSTDLCSIAVFNGEDWFVYDELRPREHLQVVLPTLQSLLMRAKMPVSDLDFIVVNRGPGSFTGIRIGMSMAQGLAFSSQCSLLAVSPLQSLAYTAARKFLHLNESEVWVGLDARMSEIYFARYQLEGQEPPNLIENEQVIAPNQIDHQCNSQTLFVGNGWHAPYDIHPDMAAKAKAPLIPTAKDNALLAMVLWRAQRLQPVDSAVIEPVYLRNNVTWNQKPASVSQ